MCFCTQASSSTKDADDDKKEVRYEHKNAEPGQAPPHNYEDIIVAMGPSTKYQLRQCLLMLSNFLPVAFINLNFIYIALQPPFACSPVNETSFIQSHPSITNGTGPYQISYDECDIHITSNASGTSKDVARVGCPQGYSYRGGKHVSFATEWDLVCDSSDTGNLVQTFMSLGSALGVVITSYFADRCGRKKTVMVVIFTSSLSEIGAAFAPNIYTMIVLRFLSGMSAACINYVTYVIGLEFLLSKHRENYAGFGGASWSLWVLVLTGIAYFFRNTTWRAFQLCSALCGVIPLVSFYFADESASWLYSQGDYVIATHIVQKMCRVNGVQFNEIKKTWERLCGQEKKNGVEEKPKNAKSNRFSDILRKKKLRIIVCAGWFLTFSNFFSYFGMFLSASTLAGDFYFNTFLMALLEFPAYLWMLLMLKYKSRRFVITFFMSTAAVCLLISTILRSGVVTNTEYVAYTSTAFFLLGRAAIGNSSTCVYLYLPELFPTPIRSSGSGLCATGGSIATMLSPYLVSLHGVAPWASGALLIFLLSTSILLLSKTLPETKGKQLISSTENQTCYMTASENRGFVE